MGPRKGAILLIVRALWSVGCHFVYQPIKSLLGICGVCAVWKLPCLLPLHGRDLVLLPCKKILCTHLIESGLSYL